MRRLKVVDREERLREMFWRVLNSQCHFVEFLVTRLLLAALETRKLSVYRDTFFFFVCILSALLKLKF